MSELDVLVVGAGISGLATATVLAQAGLDVAVWERGARPGGKIASERRDGYLLERGASLLLNFRPEVDRFLRNAGLQALKTPRAQAAERRRYVLQGGSLRAVPLSLSGLLLSSLWTWRGKLRLLAEPLQPRRVDCGESVGAFVRRRFGTELLDKAVEPFVAGTLASDAERANACSVLPRLTALERRYGSIALGVLAHKLLRRRTAMGREVFSFAGGMSGLIEHLAANPALHLQGGHEVVEIAPVREGWRVTAATAAGERSILARQVLLCSPAPAAAALLRPLDGPLAGLLDGIDYASLNVVHLGFHREAIGHRLDGVGFLAPAGEGLRLTGSQWMSSLFPDRAPPGQVLLSNYLGGCRLPKAIDWSEEACTAAVLEDLRPLLQIHGDPALAHVVRQPQALPLYHGDHPGRCAAIGRHLARWPGLHLQANYLDGVSVRDRIAQGGAIAGRIVESLGAAAFPAGEPDRPAHAVAA